jgi:hypothetical protein
METQRVLHPKLALLLTVVAISVFISNFSYSQTSTFSINGSRNVSLTAPTDKDEYHHVNIRKLVSGNVTVSITTEGLTDKITIAPLPTLVLRDTTDTTHFSGGFINISYKGETNVKTDGKIILFDGNATRDTIFLHTEDSRFFDPAHPYLINTGYKYSSKTFIPIPVHNKSQLRTFTVHVGNFTTEELSMEATLIQRYSNFSLPITNFTLAASGNSLISVPIQINFSRTDHIKDSGYVIFRNKNLAEFIDTVFFEITDSSYSHQPSLASDTLSFELQGMGIKECKNLIFTNHHDYPVTITSLTSTTSTANRFTISSVTIPYTVPAYGQLPIEVCYDAPNGHSDHTTLMVTLNLTNPAGAHGTSIAAAIGSTLDCYSLTPEKNLAIRNTLAGGRSDAFFNVMNNLDETVTLNSITIKPTSTKEQYFSFINTSFPMQLPPGAMTSVGVRFLPGENEPARSICRASLEASFTGSSEAACASASYSITSMILDPRDSFSISIFGPNEVYIPIYSTANKVIRGINVFVGAQKDIRVMSVSCLDGTHFRVVSTEPAAMPFPISPGNYFIVWLEFDAGVGGIYDDQLVIVTEDVIQTFAIPIQGVRASTASVKNSADENIQLSIAPNPSSAGVHIAVSGATVRQTVIYDVLGTAVASSSNTNEWIWDATTNGGRAADGTYFVRTEGVTADGKPFIKTEKLFLRKK